MLEAGAPAPDFALPDQNGTVHHLSDYRGRKLILYFYPADLSPGCTNQACNFRTRAEVAMIFYRLLKNKNVEITARFDDVLNDPEQWYADAAYTLGSLGIVRGRGLNDFDPRANITRAEAAAIVNRMLGRAADQEWVLANPDKLKYFPDLLDQKKWYYFDMVEASNAHDFTKGDGVEKWKVK